MSKLYVAMFFLLVCVFEGCSTAPVKKMPSEQTISMQEGVLKKLYSGQDQDEVLSLLNYSIVKSFDVKEGGKYFSYMDVMNFNTHASFGFLFEDKKLKFALVDKDANDFFSCRTPFKTNRMHWLSFGMQPYLEWLKEHDRLASGFDYRIAYPEIIGQSKLASNIETASYFIVYSPFLLIAAPIMVKDAVSGKFKKDAEKQKALIERSKKAEEILIGASESQVIGEVGEPSWIKMVDGAKVLVYENFGYSYAIKNNVVVWKESVSMFELYSRQMEYGDRIYGGTDCGRLDTFWQSKK